MALLASPDVSSIYLSPTKVISNKSPKSISKTALGIRAYLSIKDLDNFMVLNLGNDVGLYGQFSAPVKESTTSTSSEQNKVEEEKWNYFLNMGYATRTLRKEFPALIYKEMSFNIYRDDIVFKDPLNTFAGTENYKSIFWALRFHGRLLFRALWIDAISVWQPMENMITVRRTVHGIPRVPQENHARFDGTSEYKLDKFGKIYEHKVHDMVLHAPPKFKVLAVEELIQSIGCPSTPKPTYFEISSSSFRKILPQNRIGMSTMADDKKYITVEELKKHNKSGDLWISIKGKIYDVTNWVKKHPGGADPLLNMAGQDVTDAFIAFHPGSAWKHLDKFFTGYYLKDFQVSEVSKDYRRLASEFSKAGLFEKKGHGVLYSITSIILMMAVCFYGVLCCNSFWIHILSGVVLGFSWVQVTYLGHDSGHYQIMTSRGFNKMAQILTGNCLTGISIAWWKWTHNAHHIACNSLDHDPDLQHLPVLAVSARFFQSLTSHFYGRELTFDSMARFLVSYQHYTYYPIMVVGRVNLYFQTFLLLLSKRKVPDRALNILGILVFWTWFPLLVSFIPNWTERVLFVLASFTITAFQHIQFTLNHFAANVYVGPPEGNNWFQNQTGGTIDISCSPWMDFVYGGLQFQLEHHLFPRLPRSQLRKISPVVQQLCKKHDLPYRSYGYFMANVKTIQTLRTAALQARDLTNHVPKNLAWEAFHTHG